MFKALFIACCLASFPALAENTVTIGDLVNQRLSLMKVVAGYKAQQHLPIEDVAQEARVLASSQVEAARLGLEAVSVRPFIAAQMDAAKAIQYRYRADWLASPEKGGQPCSLDGVRQQIAELSSRILQLLAKRLQNGPLTEADRGAFHQAVNQFNLSEVDKERLFDALLAVKAGKAAG